MNKMQLMKKQDTRADLLRTQFSKRCGKTFFSVVSPLAGPIQSCEPALLGPHSPDLFRDEESTPTHRNHRPDSTMAAYWKDFFFVVFGPKTPHPLR